LLKLIAGLYLIAIEKIPLLREEEERRARIRTTRIAAVSVLSAFVFFAAVSYALWQRDRDVRTAAEVCFQAERLPERSLPPLLSTPINAIYAVAYRCTRHP